MKTCFALLLGAAFALPVSGQEIFKTKWKGTAIQEFIGTGSVTHFSVHGPDGWGYVYLKAHTADSSADIIRDRWQWTRVQAFTPGSVITGFETRGSDFEGWVTLTAVAANGSKGEILMTRWSGIGVQGFSGNAGEAVNGFRASGPDTAGCVTLSAVTGPIGIGEKKSDDQRSAPFVFALNPAVPNPSAGSTRISYSVAKPSTVLLSVYDCTGRVVSTLAAGNRQPGRYTVAWPGTDDRGRKVGTGVYFVKMNAGEFKAVKKVIVIR